MKIVLESITRDDQRLTSDLAKGEVVEQRVDLRVGGALRSFTVFVRANVLDKLDASVVYGDTLLEELLRIEPAALNTLYSYVGKCQRGAEVTLPLVLVDRDSTDLHLGAGPP